MVEFLVGWLAVSTVSTIAVLLLGGRRHVEPLTVVDLGRPDPDAVLAMSEADVAAVFEKIVARAR